MSGFVNRGAQLRVGGCIFNALDRRAFFGGRIFSNKRKRCFSNAIAPRCSSLVNGNGNENGVGSNAHNGNGAVPEARTKLEMGERTVRYSNLNGKLRVAVDVDEVLGCFLHSLNLFCREKYRMEYEVKDYWVYEFAKIWGCSPQMSNHIVHEFFESPQFRDGIPVMPGAKDCLSELSGWCELVVVTSRQHCIQEATEDWLDRHFAGIFKSVHFGNHFALVGGSRKKSEICREIGADVLIDDNPTYAADCSSAGMEVILYDWRSQYPWSKLPNEIDDKKIRVVTNWTEVQDALHAIRTSQESLAEKI